jgi:hypothetical protein
LAIYSEIKWNFGIGIPIFLLFSCYISLLPCSCYSKGLESHYIQQRFCDKLSTLLANTSIVGRVNNGRRIASELLTKALRERNNKDVITEIACIAEIPIECFLEQMGNHL